MARKKSVRLPLYILSKLPHGQKYRVGCAWDFFVFVSQCVWFGRGRRNFCVAMETVNPLTRSIAKTGLCSVQRARLENWQDSQSKWTRKCDQPTSATHLRPFPCWRMRHFNVEKGPRPANFGHTPQVEEWGASMWKKVQDQPTSATHLRPFPGWRMRRFNVEKSPSFSQPHSSVFQPISTNQSTVLVDIWSSSACWVAYSIRYGLEEALAITSLPFPKES